MEQINESQVTRSESKVEEGKLNGADHCIVSTDEKQMKPAAQSMDYILDTVPVEHDLATLKKG